MAWTKDDWKRAGELVEQIEERRGMTIYEYCVRHLRFMRASGERLEDIERAAKDWQRNIGVDAVKVLAESTEAS